MSTTVNLRFITRGRDVHIVINTARHPATTMRNMITVAEQADLKAPGRASRTLRLTFITRTDNTDGNLRDGKSVNH